MFMCIFHTVQEKEPVGLQLGMSLPSPGTLGAELALSEWPQGNPQHPLPLDMQGYQIFPAIKTPQKWKQQLQGNFSLHHFI